GKRVQARRSRRRRAHSGRRTAPAGAGFVLCACALYLPRCSSGGRCGRGGPGEEASALPHPQPLGRDADLAGSLGDPV
ncbi:MAG: hypothetical protein AVDCRST_MAG58-3323, partial [uncultured Rubrobacteraceae bacterium]